MIAKVNGLVEQQRRKLRRARQVSNSLQASWWQRSMGGGASLPGSTPVEYLETVRMPTVNVRPGPAQQPAPRSRTTTPLPEAWPGGPARPEFLDSDKDFGTVELPAIERYDVKVLTTHELVREEVKRFLREHHRSPDVVLLSPLRLLNVPSRWWNRYLVVFENGQQTFVALREFPGLREDEARGMVEPAENFYL
jgi:hypothetical protein